MSNGVGESLETIARQALNSVLRNVLRTRTVNVFFHRSPGNDAGGDRAISGINYRVRAQGFVIQRGTTGANGRIRMAVRGPSSTLELLQCELPRVCAGPCSNDSPLLKPSRRRTRAR